MSCTPCDEVLRGVGNLNWPLRAVIDEEALGNGGWYEVSEHDN